MEGTVSLVSSPSEPGSEVSDSLPVMKELWSPELVPYAGFGTSLTYSANWNGQRVLFVGVPRYGKELFQSGAVAVIDEDYNVDMIKGGDFGGQFGASVAVVGSILAVSAPFTACKGKPEFTCGQVHLFEAASKTPVTNLSLFPLVCNARPRKARPIRPSLVTSYRQVNWQRRMCS